ncbi:MAG: hypothetical protein SFT91_05520 [Rickettsiaceae bacterium]|nr:hypothetical protein [Rickettsiaceae bacterium]
MNRALKVLNMINDGKIEDALRIIESVDTDVNTPQSVPALTETLRIAVKYDKIILVRALIEKRLIYLFQSLMTEFLIFRVNMDQVQKSCRYYFSIV